MTQKAYQEKADKLKAGMIKYLYNSETGAVRDGLTKDKQPIDHYAQHATAFAWHMVFMKTRQWQTKWLIISQSRQN